MEYTDPNDLSPRLFRAAVEHATDGIFIAALDPHRAHHARIVYANEAFAGMLGYRADELIGWDPALLLGTDADLRSVEAIAIALDARQRTRVEFSAAHKDGSSLRVRVSLIPTADVQGTMTHLVAIQHNMAADKLLRDDLERYNRELQRSNAALEEFASVASHDLQEPLRKIRSFGERLGTSAGPALEGRSADYLARMMDAAERMQMLINDLLLFSRITAKPEPFVPVDLGHCAHQVLDTLEVLVSRTHGTVNVGELATIEADPRQIRALLQNLLSNALKFARPDVPPVIAVAGRVVPRPVDAPGDSPIGAWYEIRVADNGIGFDEQYRERIFRVFQRLHGRGIYEGSGIGLAICRRIVEYHRGTIAATSTPGAGATFAITLPIYQDMKGSIR